MLQGMDNVEPLMSYKEAQPKTHSVWKDFDATFDAKHSIVSYFSSRLLFHMLHNLHGNLSEIDVNSDGKITKAELSEYFIKSANANANANGGRSASTSTTKILIDNLFAVCDVDKDGMVSKDEILLLAINNLRFYHAEQAPFRLSIDETIAKLRDVVGELDEDMLATVRAIDTDGDGFVSRDEVVAAATKLGGVVQRNLSSVFI
jgi:Ca2+-binding EF-hand superfamily protein